jgi:prevent-host-death family protein
MRGLLHRQGVIDVRGRPAWFDPRLRPLDSTLAPGAGVRFVVRSVMTESSKSRDRGATMCYVKTISQRELRNDNAEVMRNVEQGESYTVTRRGVPVATLSPIQPDADLRCVRPPKTRPVYTGAQRVRIDVSSADLLEDLRGER